MNKQEHWDWLESHGRHPGNLAHFLVRPYVTHLGPELGARILDVGAYLGANLLYFAGLGHECVGIEACKAYCDRFEQELKLSPKLHHKPKMVHTLVEDYKSRKPFAAILCGEMLCYSPHPDEVVAKIASLLSVGGVTLITVPAIKEPEYPTYLDKNDLRRLVSASGLLAEGAIDLPGWAGTSVFAVRAHKKGKT